MLRIKADKIKNSIILVTMLLCAMNFRAKFFYFAFTTLILLFLFQRNLRFFSTSILYLLLGFLMAIYNRDEGIMSMIRCFAYFSFYIVGYNLVTSRMIWQENNVSASENYTQEIAKKIIFTIALGSFLHYLLNFINNLGSEIGRNTMDIWSGAITAATGQAALACIMMGLSVSLIILPQKKNERYIGIISICLILAYNFILAGRTLIVLLLILFFIGMVYFYIITPRKIDRYKLLFSLIIIFTIGTILYIFNFGGIQEFILNSNLLERFDSISLESGRINSKLQFLSNAYKYPLGGTNLRAKYGHAHDLLLDGYDEYGIFGFLLLLSILILGIRSLWRFLRHTDYEREFKMLVLCVYSAVLLIFVVEPILDGIPWLMVCYSLINGALDGIYVTYRRVRVTNESIAN